MPSAAFGDTLAMVLVFIGGVLTGVLIWLLMRKYNRDHRREGGTPRAATPPTLSPESTVPIMGPFRKGDSHHGTAVPVVVPPADLPALPNVPAVPPQPASEPPPVTQTTGAEADKVTAPPKKQPPPLKQGADSKYRSKGGGGKPKKSSPTSGFSPERTKEQSKSEHRRRKTKKSDQMSPSIIESGLSKRNSKSKRSKRHDSEAARDGPMDSASRATTPARTTLSQELSPPEQQTSLPSNAEAATAECPAAETHESVDPDVVKELREIVIKRRASHVSMHSMRQQRHIPTAPKVPAELDIFSEEHSEASVADATAPSDKPPAKRKHKSGKTVVVAARSPHMTAAGSPGAGSSSGSTTAVGSPVSEAARSPTVAKGATDDAGPSSTTRDVDEPTLKELREMVIKRRASCMSVHSTKSGRHAPKPPTSLDIFSEEHVSESADEEPPLSGKKTEPKVKIFSEQPSPE
ncbi:uncharacterized protein LOC144100013 [Amblyomma americanum]